MGRWTSFGQCRNKRGHGPDGLYCKQHDPEAVAKRNAETIKRQDERWEARMRPYRQREALVAALRLIAEGHNDAKTLAAETLAKWDK